MNAAKQAILLRNDINLTRSEVISLCIRASLQFLLENDESERGDTLTVALSAHEADWLRSAERSQITLHVASAETLNDMMLRAKLNDIETHCVVDDSNDLQCVALGPHDSLELDALTAKLKRHNTR